MPQHLHFEDNVKSHKKFRHLKLSTIWAYNALHIFCTRPRKYLKDQTETTFRTVFRAVCRWTDLKGSKHLDPWMFATTNKEPDADEGYHHRSCYHIYTLRVGTVTSGVVNQKHGMGSRKTILWRTLYIYPKRTPVLPMIDTALWLIIYVHPWYQFRWWFNQ